MTYYDNINNNKKNKSLVIIENNKIINENRQINELQ